MDDLTFEPNATVSSLMDKGKKFANAEQVKKILQLNAGGKSLADKAYGSASIRRTECFGGCEAS